MTAATQNTWSAKPMRPKKRAIARTAIIATPETLRSTSNEEMRRESGDLVRVNAMVATSFCECPSRIDQDLRAFENQRQAASFGTRSSEADSSQSTISESGFRLLGGRALGSRCAQGSILAIELASAGWAPLHVDQLITRGLSLVEQIVTVPADRSRLTLGLLESPSRPPAAADSPVRAGQEQAEPQQTERSDNHAVEEECASGPRHVVAEHSESVGECMRVASIGENAGHADDDSNHQNYETENKNH